tara:strand:- start:871 stop:3273 length:2403 start_codon:yes stop_codon:yes gene_type:complete
MVYTNITDLSRNNFILFSCNYNDDLSFIGTKINIKTSLPREIDKANNCYEFPIIFNNDSFSNNIFNNRVILSAQIKRDDDAVAQPFTLITQQNLYHNIKFIQKNNDFNKPRILFLKYNITNNVINNNKYLFNSFDNFIDTDSGTDNEISTMDLFKINLNDIILNIRNIYTEVGDGREPLKSLSYFFNIYKPFVNTDYYNFKFSDFIDLSRSLPADTEEPYDKKNINITTKNVSLTNEFDNDTKLNYVEDNFTNLFYFKLEEGHFTEELKPSDISIVTKLEFNTIYDYENDNILLYNKLKNLSTVKFVLNYKKDQLEESLIEDMCINFVVIKGYDYFSKYYGKIYLSNDFTYLNCRILDNNTNFYSNNSELDSSMIYLSLGNSITGITQNDLYTKMKLDIQSISTQTETSESKKLGNVSKIYFTSWVSSINIPQNMKDKRYLLEENYDYDYTNILYNNIQYNTIKFINFNLLDFYHNYDSVFSENIYNHRFNSSGLLNNEISSNHFDVNYENNNTKITANEILIDDQYTIKLNNNSVIEFKDTDVENNLLNYDFRFNFDKTFDIDIYFTLKHSYDYDSPGTTDSGSESEEITLNFHKLILNSNLITTAGSDFTHVDCVFVYYDPYSENTPDEYKYPMNNIEITTNPNIDTLTRAVELLPGAKTSVTNSTIIPARNGSNLSRKQIQGFISLNNVPRLLSIKPYDENVIDGRGFINQYQISNECKTDLEKVEIKLNSQKHISVKNPRHHDVNNNNVSKTKNFANLVRSRRLNQKLSTAQTCVTNPENIINYTTPFTNPMWRKK